MKKRLEVLKRKQLGKSKISDYKGLLIQLGFSELALIDLEQSDVILDKAKHVFSMAGKANEIILAEPSSFIDCDLLREVYFTLEEGALSYIFTDDFEYCGLFLVKSKEAIENVLHVAKSDAGHTCFVLDLDFSYFIRVNYYDDADNDNPDSYDIERSMVKALH